MVIYGALLIPILVAIVLYKFFSHKTLWWEFLIPTSVSLIAIFVMKFITESIQVSSTEYWGSFVQRVEHYEGWDEYIHRTCTRSCGKNCTTTYNCSYVSTHEPYWQIITTTGEEIEITEHQYIKIKNKFKNQKFVELNRDYYTKDGNEYYSAWDGDSSKAIPVTTEQTYENRVKASDQSVFHFRKVTPKDVKKYSLKEYPDIEHNYHMSSIIGDSSKEALYADKKFGYINGLLGHKKKVRIFVLIFKNQPLEAGFYQEWYWSGANMNEFVICIGIDNQRNVKWCKTISWTKSEHLKAEVTNFVQNQKKLNLIKLANYTKEKVNNEFVIRDFKEFDYLTVEPSNTAIFIVYFLTLLLNIALSIWIIRNEHEEENHKYGSNGRYRY